MDSIFSLLGTAGQAGATPAPGDTSAQPPPDDHLLSLLSAIGGGAAQGAPPAAPGLAGPPGQQPSPATSQPDIFSLLGQPAPAPAPTGAQPSAGLGQPGAPPPGVTAPVVQPPPTPAPSPTAAAATPAVQTTRKGIDAKLAEGRQEELNALDATTNLTQQKNDYLATQRAAAIQREQASAQALAREHEQIAQDAQARLERVDAAVDDLARRPIDSNKYLHDLSPGGGILTFLGLAMGGWSAAKTGRNDAMTFVQQQIKNGIDTQVAEYQKQLQALEQKRGVAKDITANAMSAFDYRVALTKDANARTMQMIDAMASRFDSPLVAQRAQEMKAKLLQDNAMQDEGLRKQLEQEAQEKFKNATAAAAQRETARHNIATEQEAKDKLADEKEKAGAATKKELQKTAVRIPVKDEKGNFVPGKIIGYAATPEAAAKLQEQVNAYETQVRPNVTYLMDNYSRENGGFNAHIPIIGKDVGFGGSKKAAELESAHREAIEGLIKVEGVANARSPELFHLYEGVLPKPGLVSTDPTSTYRAFLERQDKRFQALTGTQLHDENGNPIADPGFATPKRQEEYNLGKDYLYEYDANNPKGRDKEAHQSAGDNAIDAAAAPSWYNHALASSPLLASPVVADPAMEAWKIVRGYDEARGNANIAPAAPPVDLRQAQAVRNLELLQAMHGPRGQAPPGLSDEAALALLHASLGLK